jgi:PAS domain S-box-containing protein
MNTKEAHRILIIDDSSDIHDEFRRILLVEDGPATASDLPFPSFEVDCVFKGEEGLASVVRARDERRPYALAFVDIRMPGGWDGIETIEQIWKADPAMEIVVCTAFSDYSPREIARKLRRNDQLLVLKKPFDPLEVFQLAVALTEKWRLARETQAYFANLEALVNARTLELEQSISLIKASELQYRLLFESNPTPIYTYDQDSLAFVTVNEAAVLHYGYSKEEFLGMTLRDLALPEDIPGFLDKLSKLTPGAGNSGVWRHRTKAGKFTAMEITSHRLGPQKLILSLAMDVTGRLNLEAQLRQSQKMESIGQLASGIAHDFNNLLTVINGHASLLLAGEKLGAKGAESVKEIAEAGKRASALTRQLMTFSRKHELHPQVVDLNEVVNNITKMLRRILGEDVALHTDFAPGLPSIKADLGMIEQVLLNLAVNSRDAMPRGGQLRMKTHATNVAPDEARRNPDATVGQFVCLTFSDTGCGIAPENLGRIFEPFFTTKELERGTGLGLATVYGIVKQHQGWISVQSELGCGTTFEIFLPACFAPGGVVQMPSIEQTVIGGTETILVVEDEDPLLKLMHHILESHGYKVLDCSNGRQALDLWDQHKKRIDLLLTDLILPDGMAGTELAKILQASKPSLKVIFTSGYNIERLAKEFPAGTKINLIQKPFHARKLAEVVYETLSVKS